MTGPTATTTANRDFFDSNVLIYAYDPRDAAKHAQAERLLANAIANGTGVLSAQTLGEFFNTVTRRLPDALTVDAAREAIVRFSAMPVVEVDLELALRAVDTSERYQISYWDGLIIAAAERAGCVRLFSEDLNAGQSYNGVVVVNPF